jgi:hypothetical protein
LDSILVELVLVKLKVATDRESLVALVELADERSGIVMAPHVSLEVTALGKAFIALVALEGLYPHVAAPVRL